MMQSQTRGADRSARFSSFERSPLADSATLSITDHALLRWMERVHGIDVEGWRELMRQELAASLEAYQGEREAADAAFVISDHQTVVTVLSAGHRLPSHRQSIAVPRVA